MSEEVKQPQTPERIKLISDSESSDTELDIHFSPIISLPEVPISTNEENEEEFLKIRAKLYRFVRTTDPPEWKERGIGELKILRHQENGSFRIVMRRDKVLKVCANHFITPWMELKTSRTNEKAFIYTVNADFADEECKSECLAVKFATEENARLFKTRFEDAQKKLLVDCDLYNGKVDELIRKELEQAANESEDSAEEDENGANEISEQLSTLKVTENKEETEKPDEKLEK